MISAQIIKDSLNTDNGARLTTWILNYPRFVHAELLTHRMFSKNSASSRAIPIEKVIKEIEENPAMPIFWGKNQKGMSAAEDLDDKVKRFRQFSDEFGNNVGEDLTDLQYAKKIWLQARDGAIRFASSLQELGLHKQITNRLLEPWFYIRVILTATEFDNFFALRAHEDAQPELRALAYLMLEQYNNNTPECLKPGEWHIPFGDKIDENRLNVLPFVMEESERLDKMGFVGDYTSHYYAKQEAKKRIAVARCARISYLNFEGKDDYNADIHLCDRLFKNNPKHLSPTEHVAQAVSQDVFIGNFRGWKQYRKFFDSENLKDPRVKIKKI